MNIKCGNCGEDVLSDFNNKWGAWLRLHHLLGLLELNGDITPALYESLVNDLMEFKRFAEGDFDDAIRGWRNKPNLENF